MPDTTFSISLSDAAFLRRLKSQPGRVLHVEVVTNPAGDFVFWKVEDAGKAEGLAVIAQDTNSQERK